MIFQTENQLIEIGDKIPAQHKPAIEQALQQLKDAHKAGDVAAIDTAIAALNNAWQTASQQMYQQSGAAGQPGGDTYRVVSSSRLSRKARRLRTSRMPTSRRSNETHK